VWYLPLLSETALSFSDLSIISKTLESAKTA
jgi:hypothetical protein